MALAVYTKFIRPVLINFFWKSLFSVFRLYVTKFDAQFMPRIVSRLQFLKKPGNSTDLTFLLKFLDPFFTSNLENFSENFQTSTNLKKFFFKMFIYEIGIQQPLITLVPFLSRLEPYLKFFIFYFNDFEMAITFSHVKKIL